MTDSDVWRVNIIFWIMLRAYLSLLAKSSLHPCCKMGGGSCEGTSHSSIHICNINNIGNVYVSEVRTYKPADMLQAVIVTLPAVEGAV